MPRRIKSVTEVRKEQFEKSLAILQNGIVQIEAQVTDNSLGDIVNVCLYVGENLKGLSSQERERTVSRLLNKLDQIKDQPEAPLAMLIIGAITAGWTDYGDPSGQRVE